MAKLPKWVTYGKIFHKVRSHAGPLCGNFKMGDDTTGDWKKTSCAKCLEWREKHQYDRQKRYAKREADKVDLDGKTKLLEPLDPHDERRSIQAKKARSSRTRIASGAEGAPDVSELKPDDEVV